MATSQQDPNDAARGAAAPATTASTVHEAILDTLASAVVSLDPNGVITTFNATAAVTTGLAAEEVVGRTFAEVFLGLDGAEEFTQAVLDAVYHGPLVRQRVVPAEFPAGRRTLSVSVSHVKDDASDDPGVAVVFEDISELRELRAKELELAREVEAQHQELKSAYLRLESQNLSLAERQKRTRPARVGAIAAGVVLLMALALYGVGIRPESPAGSADARIMDRDDAAAHVVEPRRLTRAVIVTGRLAPRREVDITSPMSGKIASVHVPFGARVERGQPLIELDVAEVRIQHRDAEAARIKALERFNETRNWSEGVDASRARRSVTKAGIELEDSRSRLGETEFLLERGVIPASEHEAAERSFHSRQLDLEAAEQDLATVLAKGEADGRVAQLELENALARVEELDQTLRLAVLRAPVAGVVMRPQAASSSDFEGGGRERIAGGDSVTQGERLLVVGDLEGLSVVGRVDEVDVTRIEPGDPVSVRGDAYPGTVLHGIVERVSSQAITEARSRSLPSFEIAAVIESIDDRQRAVLRIGMSAVMEVIVLDKADALLVPINAVVLDEGRPSVRVARDDDVVRIPVTVGETTADSIEIVEGVVPGDRILVDAQ